MTFELMQNYPNPFNPTTKIEYSLPNSGKVLLKIFDALGQTVEVLVNDIQSAGSYSVNFDGSNLSSGVYIYQLQYNNQQITKKMNLVK
ncbi:MAG: T9SS type A sorting domain-containing protein [Melioribacteraceae bacterium]|nr:T9SS type A sorting domain-containing protein [Melioribacteraceae bacterium]